MSELRWILLLIGALIVVAVYAYTRYQRRARDEAARGVAKGASTGAPGEDALMADPGRVAEPEELPAIGLGRNDDAGAGGDAPRPPTEDLLVMHVRADEGAPWSGTAILKAAEAAGLRCTDKNVFQYFLGEEHALFYVANMFKPGVFDWRRMDEFTTRGLSLFMRLPPTCAATEALKAMLGCAGKLTEILGGDMLGAERRPLSEEALAKMRTLCEAHDEARGMADQPRA